MPARWKVHPVFHVSLLRPFRQSDRFARDAYSEPPPLLIDGEEEYEIDRIVQERVSGRGRSRRREFLVRWKGYGPEEDTWLAETDFANAQDVLRQWLNG